MKNIIAAMLFISLTTNVFAQEDEEQKGFKKENFFTGGSLNLSFGTGFTSYGISPHFGYSINKWLDVAVTASVNHQSEKQYDIYGNNAGKIKQTIYGPGAFVRIFPVKFLYAQAQYEFNLINLKYVYPNNTGYPTQKLNVNASSLLVGAGYAGGRDEYNKSYYYLSIMWDVAKGKYSPYMDNSRSAVPIIRAGYNIALFQNKTVIGRRTSN